MQNQNELTIFYSYPFSKNFLQKSYEKLQIPNAKAKSFENCDAFISYIDSGLIYLEDARRCHFRIKPLLIFYAIVHFVKACVLTVDPDYPNTTSVMAHGVSTRKKKKNNYAFLNDEIKLQKNGLFAHAAKKMYNLDLSTYDKFNMRTLLQQVQELEDIFQTYFPKLETASTLNMPLILDYYLILYNLSMICRYETKWWSELFKNTPHHDYAFIHKLLKIANDKTETEVYNWFICRKE